MQQQSLVNVRTTKQKHPGLFPFPSCTIKIRASEDVKIALTRYASYSSVNVDFKTGGEVKRGVSQPDMVFIYSQTGTRKKKL